MSIVISAGTGLRIIIFTGLFLLTFGNAAYSQAACVTDSDCGAGEMCVNDMCTPPDCDDFDPSTSDSFDPVLGCVHTPGAEVPELEDYAAAAFLILALTIGWQVRRRNLPVA